MITYYTKHKYKSIQMLLILKFITMFLTAWLTWIICNYLYLSWSVIHCECDYKNIHLHKLASLFLYITPMEKKKGILQSVFPSIFKVEAGKFNMITRNSRLQVNSFFFTNSHHILYLAFLTKLQMTGIIIYP